MRRKVVLTLIGVLISGFGNCQQLQWAKSMTGTNTDEYSGISVSVCVDKKGNVYTTGFFSGTIDFDPGPNTTRLTSNGLYDIFIQKMDAAGNFLWAKSFGDNDYDYGRSITTDEQGNVYITGIFAGSIDFDTGPAVAKLNSVGDTDMFILKLDDRGNLVWVKRVGDRKEEAGSAIKTDAKGNIYLTGYFRGYVDFNKGGVKSYRLSSGEYGSMFVQKLDADGNLLWAKAFAAFDAGSSSTFCLDAMGNIYITGNFRDSAAFPFGTKTVKLIAAGFEDGFILKLTTTGDPVWVKQIGGAGFDNGKAIAADASGNIYTIGTFQKTVDFNPGVGTESRTSAGFTNTFIQKLDADGNFIWVRTLVGKDNVLGYAVTVDASGNIYTTGRFKKELSFENSTIKLVAASPESAFILKMDANGNFIWAKESGSTGYDICTDHAGNMYATGYFVKSCDFDPGPGTEMLKSENGSGIFVLKWKGE